MRAKATEAAGGDPSMLSHHLKQQAKGYLGFQGFTHPRIPLDVMRRMRIEATQETEGDSSMLAFYLASQMQTYTSALPSSAATTHPPRPNRA